MKRILLAVLLLTCCTCAARAQARKTLRAPGAKSAEKSVEAKSVEAALISNERRSWESVKRKDYAAFESLLAEDFYDIFPDGKTVTKTELMRDYIRGVNLIEYTLSNFHVVMLNRDAAIVAYETTARGSENKATAYGDEKKGQIISIHSYVTSAWARRRGRWLNVFYRENEIK